MPLILERNDICRVQADALVNAANSSLAPGGGVCGALFAAAGYDRLERACRAIGHCPVGGAVSTPAFDIANARYIIHAVGPIWSGGGSGERELLERSYTSALEEADRLGCASIAFPLISAGIYGYPPRQALRAAETAIGRFLDSHDMTVYLVFFNRNMLKLGEERFGDIAAYIDDHYAEKASPRRGMSRAEWQQAREQRLAPPDEEMLRFCNQAEPENVCSPFPSEPAQRHLTDLLGHLDDDFSSMLLRLIDEKGLTDVEVYKRANMDRKLFSRIRKGQGYNPSKPTAIALCIALHLNLDETRDLLGRAGFALSHSSRFDVIIEYFISRGIYDVFEINDALFAFDQKLLGA